VSAQPEELAHRLRPAAGDPDGALVLLHGRGTDEADLLPLLDLFDPERRLVGVVPRGPLSLPPGGRHWYVVPRVGFPDPATFADSYASLERFFTSLDAATGVPWERTVIGGFSQGTVMSYALGLGAGQTSPAGIVALSGFIPSVDGWEADLDRAGLPVFIAHGRRDPVISVDFARAANERLTAAGLDVSYHESDAGHHLDEPSMRRLPGWIDAAIDRATASP
jgi:phospholipase/carboxylesterase